MDIAANYRATLPPKEHEEAVRMLLDSIASKKQQDPQLKRRNPIMKQSLNSTQQNTRQANSTMNFSDRSSLKTNSSNSATNSSLSFRQSNNQNSNRIQQTTNNMRLMSNYKTTSNNEDSVSSRTSISFESSRSASIRDEEEQEQFDSYKEPIPSRTIAVQCDLKPSSLRTESSSFDTSMQASSVSATKYGFYNFSQETLDQRRKLQQQQQLQQLQLETYKESENEETIVTSSNQTKMMMEAPTSMSELSSSSSSLNQQQQRQQYKTVEHVNKRLADSQMKANSAYKLNSNIDLRDNLNSLKTASKGNLSERHLRDTTKRTLTTNSRLNLLPRRPMTALSYVSSSHLRDANNKPTHYDHDHDLDCDSSCDESGAINQARPIKSHHRAYSQQVLPSSASMVDSNANLTPTRPTRFASRANMNSNVNLNNQQANKQPPSSSSAESNSDLDHSNNQSEMIKQIGKQSARHRSSDQYKVSSQDEDDQIESKKLEQSSPSISRHLRPVLLKSIHNEHVEEVNLNESNSNLNTNQRRSSNRNRPIVTSTNRNINTNTLQREQHLPKMEENFNSYELHEQRAPTWERQLPTNGYDLNGYSDAPYNSNSKALNFDDGRRSDVRSRSMYTKNPSNSMSFSKIQSNQQQPQPQPQMQRDLYNQPTYYNEYEGEYILNDNRSQTLTRSAEQTRNKINRQSNRVRDENMNQRENFNKFKEELNHRQMYDNDDDDVDGDDDDLDEPEADLMARSTSMRHLGHNNRLYNHDSDSPSTKTWANPSADIDTAPRRHIREAHQKERNLYKNNNYNVKSYNSMKDIDNVSDFDRASSPVRANNLYNYNYRYQNNNKEDSNSTNSSAVEQTLSYVQTQPLNYDSQHRVNESRLPEVNPNIIHQTQRRPSAPSSYIGLPIVDLGKSKKEVNQFSAYTLGRSPKITGRAMSQQSLTRPTMGGLTSGRRRRRAGGSNSGSDVGGSSMSLVSRFNGRYENAHTRTPVIMYIPQATPKPSATSSNLSEKSLSRSSFMGRSGSTLRKSIKSPFSKFNSSKSSSQDRLRRAGSNSKNGSDSETSSMMRTLVKSRSSRAGSRRGINSSNVYKINNNNHHQIDYLNEDDDGVGQLMTEVDSYKFKRRYSVPKDAKINWFAKLKQKVSSTGK